MLLIAYRAAAEAALASACVLRAADRLSGGRLLPARWRLAERLDPPRGTAAVAAPGGRIWLHAASLGECKGLWAFARELRDFDPDLRLVLTANTAAGVDFLRAAASRDGAADRAHHTIVATAPLDHPRVARRFLKALDVRALVLFEVELWPHVLAAARRADVPALWISARLTERARRRYAGNPLAADAFRRVLADVAWIQAQTDDDAHALRRLGARDVETGGDLRGLHSLRAPRAPDGSPVGNDARAGIAFVSFHADELDALVAMIKGIEGIEDTPLRVFPRALRELPRFWKRLAPLGFRLHSRDPGAARGIVDSFGRVDDALRTARVAVIGGSFASRARTGGHNLWEPLRAGARMVIGPDHGNQKYLAEKLARAGLLRVAGNAAAAIEAVKAASFSAATDSYTADARKTFVEAERARLVCAARDAAHKVREHALKHRSRPPKHPESPAFFD